MSLQLVVVHPEPTRTIMEVDQDTLRSGSLLLFLDNHTPSLLVPEEFVSQPQETATKEQPVVYRSSGRF
jgi:hypothetical protein